jgi:hypothetical protein
MIKFRQNIDNVFRVNPNQMYILGFLFELSFNFSFALVFKFFLFFLSGAREFLRRTGEPLRPRMYFFEALYISNVFKYNHLVFFNEHKHNVNFDCIVECIDQIKIQ